MFNKQIYWIQVMEFTFNNFPIGLKLHGTWTIFANLYGWFCVYYGTNKFRLDLPNLIWSRPNFILLWLT